MKGQSLCCSPGVGPWLQMTRALTMLTVPKPLLAVHLFEISEVVPLPE